MPDKFNLIRRPKSATGIFRKLRWKHGLTCIHCGCIENVHVHNKATTGIWRYLCKNCGDLGGTLFQNTKLPLWKWLYVLITLLQSTGSLSAAEVARKIHVSYPTAYRMMKKVRRACMEEPFIQKLSGIVESDEAWVSRKDNQTVLLGMVERQGSLKIFPIQDRKAESLAFPHKLHVEAGSMVCTDAHAGYTALSYRFIHHWVNHSQKQWVWRHIHTNTIEGVWSMLKGVLRTIHHGVSKRHLLDYCNLFSFMYSHRNKSIHDRFFLLFNKFIHPRCCLY